MPNYSRPHICQCLSRLLGFRRHFPVTVTGNSRKTGQQLVEEVLSLAQGLLHLGLAPGHVVAMSAYNRYPFLCSLILNFLSHFLYYLRSTETASVLNFYNSFRRISNFPPC
ncbi:hypothetical protein V8G54_033028 [Vigna mungo]|uniref:AMP-dependent synthetase/ligase domain-containing protein n=1 Tax=Vigna mungo TaxID=3915 RepID=A0AAQ3RJD2_VIGMU